mmetsp:Transcript_17151/g.20789  ORF Transcript_17151/g.20789 Transcript_17151/m.20789 type:complete len:384 (+) Transcript_17151:186-1337(+)
MGNNIGEYLNGENDLGRKAKLKELVSMGFEESPAQYALVKTNFNVQEAVAYLLNQNEVEASVSNSVTVKTSPFVPKQMKTNEGSNLGKSNQVNGNSGASARTTKAALAAINRQDATKTKRIPRSNNSSKVPDNEKSSSSSLEKKMESRASRLAETPKALDALVFLIKAIENNPADEKFRVLKVQNRTFKSTIALSPAGPEFLKLLGFRAQGYDPTTRLRPVEYRLSRRDTDLAKLWMGKAVLEKAKEGNTYRLAKAKTDFQSALRKSLKTANEEELRRRKEYAKLLAKEPSGNSSISVIKIFLGENLEHSRRFFCDDTLESVVQWLGSLSSIIPDKLLMSEWDLVDVSLYPAKRIPIPESLGSTLQSLGWFPSGQMEIIMHKE